MILCVLNSQNFEALLGTPKNPTGFPIVFVAQKPDCSSFLVLVETIHVALTQVTTVPSGYDFTYCQAWGLTINDEVVARVVDHLQYKKKLAVDDHCSMFFSTGFTYETKTFQICGESQRRIAARTTYALASKINAVAFPWVSPHSDGWWDVGNVVLSSTQTVDGFLAFAKAASDYCAACSKCCRDHKSAVTAENCTTYDYSAGWPV